MQPLMVTLNTKKTSFLIEFFGNQVHVNLFFKIIDLTLGRFSIDFNIVCWMPVIRATTLIAYFHDTISIAVIGGGGG